MSTHLWGALHEKDLVLSSCFPVRLWRNSVRLHWMSSAKDKKSSRGEIQGGKPLSTFFGSQCF